MLMGFFFWSAVLVQLFFYGFVFSRLAFGRSESEYETKSGGKWQAVTVLICARNEAENLRRFLPYVLQQNYPDFEVVVVNDGSTDNTAAVLNDLAKNNTRLHIVTLNDDRQQRQLKGKKYALAAGIKASRNDILLLTDADCKPESDDWVALMAQAFEQESCEVVLGYSPYAKQGGFLNKLVQYETIYAAMQYLSLAILGMPYMGVGRNLSYRKKLYSKGGGFDNHGKLLSGDDDLFVNRMANKHNTKVSIHRSSFCTSIPPTSYGKWVRQKSRHVSTGKHYAPLHVVILFALYASHSLFYIGFFGLMASAGLSKLALGAAALRMGMMCFVFWGALKKLNHTDLLFFIPFLDFLFVLYYLAALPTSLTGFSRKWD